MFVFVFKCGFSGMVVRELNLLWNREGAKVTTWWIYPRAGGSERKWILVCGAEIGRRPFYDAVSRTQFLPSSQKY